MLVLVLWVCALGIVQGVHAGEKIRPPPQGSFWSLQMENDLWGSGDDRFYSHGTQISYLRPGTAPDWLRDAARRVPFFELGDAQAFQFSLGHQIFTPADTEATTLIGDDRPYAGWLFATAELLTLLREDENHQVGNIFGITLGVVGPDALGEDIQNNWHDIIGVDRANGWEHQLDNEVGINLNYTRRWQWFHRGPLGTEIETAPHLTVALGNVYTYAGGGGLLRWGKGLRNDFAPPSIRPGFPGIPYLRPSIEPSWYLFGGIEGRAVARNIFLDGNTFSDSHSVDRKPLVADLQFGLAYQWRGVRLAVSNIVRSAEFDGQPEETRFGAINLSFFISD